MKANELSKSLHDLGFEEAEVERLVKSRIDDGTIEDVENYYPKEVEVISESR